MPTPRWGTPPPGPVGGALDRADPARRHRRHAVVLRATSFRRCLGRPGRWAATDPVGLAARRERGHRRVGPEGRQHRVRSEHAQGDRRLAVGPAERPQLVGLAGRQRRQLIGVEVAGAIGRLGEAGVEGAIGRAEGDLARARLALGLRGEGDEVRCRAATTDGEPDAHHEQHGRGGRQHRRHTVRPRRAAGPGGVDRGHRRVARRPGRIGRVGPAGAGAGGRPQHGVAEPTRPARPASPAAPASRGAGRPRPGTRHGWPGGRRPPPVRRRRPRRGRGRRGAPGSGGG